MSARWLEPVTVRTVCAPPFGTDRPHGHVCVDSGYGGYCRLNILALSLSAQTHSETTGITVDHIGCCLERLAQGVHAATQTSNPFNSRKRPSINHDLRPKLYSGNTFEKR
jgi:hypothetical protein